MGRHIKILSLLAITALLGSAFLSYGSRIHVAMHHAANDGNDHGHSHVHYFDVHSHESHGHGADECTAHASDVHEHDLMNLEGRPVRFDSLDQSQFDLQGLAVLSPRITWASVCAARHSPPTQPPHSIADVVVLASVRLLI